MNNPIILPTYRDAVDKAVSAENLKAVASKATDPEVLLGLAFLAKEGCARQEISAMAVKAKPAYAPIVVVLAIAMDPFSETCISELIQCDPDNALGYYLKTNLLHQADKADDALEAFRKAAHCSELRLYEDITGAALFRALDPLELKGRDRLCALCWMATRVFNFGAIGQTIKCVLPELALVLGHDKREEISDLQLVLAGHLYAVNFQNRHFAQWALESAFRLKAEAAAAENTPKMVGYAAASHALTSGMVGWPGIDDQIAMSEKADAVLFLPERIHRALIMSDPAKRKMLCEMKANPPASDQAAFAEAVENASKAEQALLDVALSDPDGIIGPYLKGMPASLGRAEPCLLRQTPVEALMAKRPDVFKAAVANERAMNALCQAGKNDPSRRNIVRMMEIGQGLHRYAFENNNTYPDCIEVLFEMGYLEAPVDGRSVLTGNPYVYVGAGEKRPTKSSGIGRLVLLYDDHALEQGDHQCLFTGGVGGTISMNEIREQLGRRKT